MTLIDPVLAELPHMRAMAESLMADAGSAKRPAGRAYAFDAATGKRI